jgi:hypothetical protein
MLGDGIERIPSTGRTMSRAAREQGLLDGRTNVSDSMIMSDFDSQMSFTDSDVSRFQNKLDGH